MLIFSHAYLLFIYLTKTYFCGIYEYLWDFIGIKITKFSNLKSLPDLLADDRTSGRSTGLVDRYKRNMHKDQPSRPVDRAVDRLKSTHSRVLPVDREVDRQVVPVDRRHNDKKYDRWAGRPEGYSGHFWLQRLEFLRGYK